MLSWLSVYPFDVIKARLQATSKAESPYTGDFCSGLMCPAAFDNSSSSLLGSQMCRVHEDNMAGWLGVCRMGALRGRQLAQGGLSEPLQGAVFDSAPRLHLQCCPVLHL